MKFYNNINHANKMNPYLRQDIENTIEEYWCDIHKSKFNQVLKEYVDATHGILDFLDKFSDLNILRCPCNNCDEISIKFYRISRVSESRNVVDFCHIYDSPIGNIERSETFENVILREYIKEICQRFISQGR